MNLFYFPSLQGIRKDQVEFVELIGGSTRVPAIRKIVGDFFGNKEGLISTTLNLDEAVARGAALQVRVFSSPCAFYCFATFVTLCSFRFSVGKFNFIHKQDQTHTKGGNLYHEPFSLILGFFSSFGQTFFPSVLLPTSILFRAKTNLHFFFLSSIA